MSSAPPTSEEEGRERRRRAWRIVGWVGGTLALLDGLAVLFGLGSQPPPHALSAPPPPAKVAPASIPASAGEITAVPIPEPTATVRPPAPRLVPASNSFTTLADYRQRRAAAPHPPEPMTPAPAGRIPETELGRVSMLVRDFRAAYGANPVGNNREIVRTLLGDNPNGTRFLDPGTVSLNDRGELLDAWGHPYFFHALSGTTMEIRSAGPDGVPYTADDLVR